MKIFRTLRVFNYSLKSTIVFELSFDSFVKQRDVGSLDLKLNLMLIYETNGPNGHRQFFTMSSSNSLFINTLFICSFAPSIAELN